MEITSKQEGAVTRVSIQGSVDGMTAGQLLDSLGALVRAGQVRLVADFTGVEYISSAGLRALLGSVKESRQAGGDLRIAGAAPDVKRVLDLSGFSNILKMYPDAGTAVASFGS